jgi:hypothetical protein
MKRSVTFEPVREMPDGDTDVTVDAAFPIREAAVLTGQYDIESFHQQCKPLHEFTVRMRHDVDSVSMVFSNLLFLDAQPVSIFLHPHRTRGRFVLDEG